MELDKLKKRINDLFGIVVEGDINTRMNYLARLLDHLDVFIDQKDLTDQTKNDILMLEGARQSYNSALDPWSKYLANNPNGLARATIFSDEAIRSITKIMETNNINTSSNWQFKHVQKPDTTTASNTLPDNIFKGDS
jgi:hypothetical protein